MQRPMIYRDTRGSSGRTRPTFTDVVIAGIAPGGGLFVPEEVPRLSLAEILVFAEWPYWRRAAAVFSRFGVDLSSERIDARMRSAYASQWDDERIAPVTRVGDMHVLELWHGPTCAFKDIALQCMPLFFSEAAALRRIRGGPAEDYLVLVATSGDTGKAALEGFADRPGTGVIVFYPADGVSDVQRLQMATQRGANVGVFGVEGNFDDCQNGVKAAFNDDDFAKELGARWDTRLSSANSINWGRLLPQVVYYVSAYADMIASGALGRGDEIDVCVPTGNFGNILGAYYAQRMGVPIRRLLCASNENRVLADFIDTGIYDISDRPFVTTPSPSMDILVSSNLERLLFELTQDSGRVRGWMDDLATHRRFEVDTATFSQMRDLLSGAWVTNDESLDTIRAVWETEGYLVDPHTAVAWRVAERLRDDAPVLVVSTAHWAKFGADVFRALNGLDSKEPLTADAAALTGLELVDRVSKTAPDASPVPRPLAALGAAEERFTKTIAPGREGVESAIREWLPEHRLAMGMTAADG